MFNLGVYPKDVLLSHLKKHEIISSTLVDGNGYIASDYFDILHNEWSISGISKAFDDAHVACMSMQ